MPALIQTLNKTTIDNIMCDLLTTDQQAPPEQERLELGIAIETKSKREEL